jgi:hypothetical protein
MVLQLHRTITRSLFRSAARVVQNQLREYLENSLLHSHVKIEVPTESAEHVCQNASAAYPSFQMNHCSVSSYGLHIKCDWNGRPSLRARVSAASLSQFVFFCNS